MLRFTPEQANRFEQAHRMDLHVGGSESNTAVGLARLGRRVAWVSRITDNSLGRIIERTIRSHGVDTDSIVWTEQDRVGLYFLENGSPPRGSRVIYDRANSAFSKFEAKDLPVDLFQPGRAKWLLVTGISMAVSETACRMIEQAIELALKAGWRIAFDVNYRALLCSRDRARTLFDPVVKKADLVFVAHRDAVGIWNHGTADDPERTLREMLAMRGGKTTVMTLGRDGAIAGCDQEVRRQSIEPVEPIGRLGGGDAFSAGFLHAWLDEESIERALRWATTVARLKYSIPGDLPLIELAEVLKLMESPTSNAGSIVR
jgi:2-dehydro-3-deoxygluconokinase